MDLHSFSIANALVGNSLEEGVLEFAYQCPLLRYHGKKINIAVAGATGYVGLDLIKFLSNHHKVNIKYLCAQKKIGKNIQFFDKRINYI